MASIRATGNHRAQKRVIRRIGIAGATGIAAVGVLGSVASPALAANSDLRTAEVGLTQARGLDGVIADTLSRQAMAQQVAAEKARAEAQAKQAAAAAKKKAAAEKAKKERAAEERAARAKRAALHGYVAPVANSSVSTGYQTGGSLWSSGSHSGIDFRASAGTTVKSVAAGEVVEAGWGGSYGNQVVVRHKDGQYTQYGHMSSLSVSVGQSVTSGQQVGLVGSTGNSTGPHLHFEVRTGPDYGSDVDPLAYLRGKGVSL